MNGRPIYTLEEDLQQLGVISEMDPQARKAEMFAKQQAKKQAAFAKQQAKKQAAFAKKNPAAMQNQDIWDDIDADDVMDEARTKIHKMRGIAKIKSRLRSRKYYRKMKRKLKRMRKSSLYKRHQAKLKKMGKSMRGFRRKVATTGKSLMARLGLSKGRQHSDVDFDSTMALAEVADALNFDTNVGHYGTAFQEIGLLARELSEAVEELSEDYVSTVTDYADLAEAAQGIANESMEFARAINEHDDDVTGSDLGLLGNHFCQMVEELDALAEMYDVNVDAINLTEGEDEDEDEDDDLEYVSDDELQEMIDAGVVVLDETFSTHPGASYSPRRRGGPHGEYDLDVAYAESNVPSDEIFNVMHPLGISRADSREKLVLARQLRRETAEDVDFDEDDLL